MTYRINGWTTVSGQHGVEHTYTIDGRIFVALKSPVEPEQEALILEALEHLSSDLRKFEEGYAARSGTTIARLKELGREARPCDCGDERCEGWQMVNAREFDTDHGI